MKLEVEFIDAGALRAIGELSAALSPGRRRGLMAVLGRTAQKEIQRHFAWAESAKPNRQGFKRAHFWKDMRTATAYDESQTTDELAVVTIADARIRTHLFGGVIRPVNAKNLAIPLCSRAYGVTPRSGLIAGLFFIPSKRRGNTSGWLAATEGKKTTFYYRLQKQVEVRRDPSALPSPERLGAALLEAAAERLKL